MENSYNAGGLQWPAFFIDQSTVTLFYIKVTVRRAIALYIDIMYAVLFLIFYQKQYK